VVQKLTMGGPTAGVGAGAGGNVWQRSPLRPPEQLQTKPAPLAIQVPPPWHGLGAQGFTQLPPEQPASPHALPHDPQLFGSVRMFTH
jgi:hypothetical protein